MIPVKNGIGNVVDRKYYDYLVPVYILFVIFYYNVKGVVYKFDYIDCGNAGESLWFYIKTEYRYCVCKSCDGIL